VEHPHAVEYAPQLVATRQQFAGDGREVEGWPVPVIELDAPEWRRSSADFAGHIGYEIGRCDGFGPGVVGRRQGSDRLLVRRIQAYARGCRRGPFSRRPLRYVDRALADPRQSDAGRLCPGSKRKRILQDARVDTGIGRLTNEMVAVDRIDVDD